MEYGLRGFRRGVVGKLCVFSYFSNPLSTNLYTLDYVIEITAVTAIQGIHPLQGNAWKNAHPVEIGTGLRFQHIYKGQLSSGQAELYQEGMIFGLGWSFVKVCSSAEGDQRNLRWAAKTYVRSQSADSAGDVDMAVMPVIESGDVFFPKRGQPHGSVKRGAYLSSVSVARQLKNQARIGRDVIKKIRLVYRQD